MQSGPGVLKDKLGEYVGEFHNNMKHGKGVYTDRISGIIYEGEYFKDEQTGYGVHIYPSGLLRSHQNIDFVIHGFYI